jgi:hypothetical protein
MKPEIEGHSTIEVRLERTPMTVSSLVRSGLAAPSGPAQYQGNLLIAGINPLGRNLTYKVGLKLTEM